MSNRKADLEPLGAGTKLDSVTEFEAQNAMALYTTMEELSMPNPISTASCS